jgi:AraC family transcriptional activator of pobA
MNKLNRHVPLHAITTKEIGPSGFGIIDLVGKGGNTYDSSVPHRHTFFELLFFVSGRGIHEIDFNLFPVENNDVHFVSPGQIHRLTLQKAKGYVLCFTEDFISLKSKEIFAESFPFYGDSGSPTLKLTRELSAEINSLVTLVSEELKPGKTADTDVLRSYLNIILLKLKSLFLSSRKNIQQSGQTKKQKVTQFKKLINESYLLHKNVSTYADELNVTPNHLNALCKKHEGKTATQLIQERLLLESKRLLYATEMNIKEICYDLKFEDVPYFNRFFKKQTNLTPLQYRRQSAERSLKSASS